MDDLLGMTREKQIIKQADIYAEWSGEGGLSVTNVKELVEKAFIEGAKWADNNIHLSSLWNDINIVPSDNKGILYLTKNGKIGAYSLDANSKTTKIIRR